MHIYLATDGTAREFSYRGEAGPDDDPQAFKRLMEQRGYTVLIRADNKPGTGRRIARAEFPELATH